MKKSLIYLVLLFIPIFLFAHTLILNVYSNEDGTITIQGMFNTGQLATGAQVRLESLIDGKLLFKKRLPQESELTVKIPQEQYQIVLDGGPGHQIVKDGIAPKGGFSKKIAENTKKANISKSKNAMQTLPIEMIISILCAFILLLLTILISIRNTNKLMKQLKNSNNT